MERSEESMQFLSIFVQALVLALISTAAYIPLAYAINKLTDLNTEHWILHGFLKEHRWVL